MRTGGCIFCRRGVLRWSGPTRPVTQWVLVCAIGVVAANLTITEKMILQNSKNYIHALHVRTTLALAVFAVLLLVVSARAQHLKDLCHCVEELLLRGLHNGECVEGRDCNDFFFWLFIRLCVTPAVRAPPPCRCCSAPV